MVWEVLRNRSIKLLKIPAYCEFDDFRSVASLDALSKWLSSSPLMITNRWVTANLKQRWSALFEQSQAQQKYMCH